jgi:hypothetical protein
LPEHEEVIESIVYATFGQELYLRETASAAGIIAQSGSWSERDGLTAQLAESLNYSSASMRTRVAEKLLQRLAAGSSVSERRFAFARLVAGIGDSEAQRELIYYAVARTDGLIGAIARDALTPYFLDGQPPRGATEDDLAKYNTGRLLTIEPMLTLPFLTWYARESFGFTSARTVALAMRILRQAGIILSVSLSGAPKRTLAYTLAPHGLSLAAFLWCLYDEFSCDPLAPSTDRIERAAFARTFVVPPAVIGARLREAEREGWIQFDTIAGTRRVYLPLSTDQLMTALLPE